MTIQVMAPIWWCCARLSPQVNARPPQRSAGPRLGQAGVPVEFHLHPGAPHEFDFIAFNTTAARCAIADRVLSSTGCPCPSPVAAVQPALINDRRSVLAAQPAPIR